MSETIPEARETARAALAGIPFKSEADFEAQVAIAAKAINRALLARDERAAQIIEAYMLCEDASGSEVLWPRSNPGNKVGLSYASAIRDRSRT